MMGILNVIKPLEEIPNKYQTVDDPDLSELVVRYAYCKNYTISYSVPEADTKVEVYRVLYSGSDVKNKLLGTIQE